MSGLNIIEPLQAVKKPDDDVPVFRFMGFVTLFQESTGSVVRMDNMAVMIMTESRIQFISVN